LDIEKKRERDRINMARWRANNPEKYRATLERAKSLHLEEYRARALTHYYSKGKQGPIDSAKWRASNPEKVRENSRRNYQENIEREHARIAKYRIEHPEIRKYSGMKRRARKSGASGRDYITIALVDSRCEYYGHRCYLCGEPASAIDHVKPLAKGGSQWPSNLRPICGLCNSRKGGSWPYDFAEHRKRASREILKHCAVLDLVTEF
jgi:5-methylcytosine-specific restriction endonuclease McrA